MHLHRKIFTGERGGDVNDSSRENEHIKLETVNLK